MIKNFIVSDKIGDIVSVFPGASNLFKGYKIDFCCGGNRELKEAIAEGALEEDIIIKELNERYIEFQVGNEKFIDWAKATPSKLIDYIIGTHHEYLNEELPRISELVYKILKVHGKKHEELFEIHRLVNALKTELEEHLVKEEEFVFPLIKEYDIIKNDKSRQEVINLINELEKEHTGAGDIIKELREVTNHYAIPKGACRTFEVTYKKLNELESDIFQHIHLENNILFKNI